MPLHHNSRKALFHGCSATIMLRHPGHARSQPSRGPPRGGEGGTRVQVQKAGSCGGRAAAEASSACPQQGRTAAAATSRAASAARWWCRSTEVAGGCCSGTAEVARVLAVQPARSGRHPSPASGAAPTTATGHGSFEDTHTDLCNESFHSGPMTGVFKLMLYGRLTQKRQFSRRM